MDLSSLNRQVIRHRVNVKILMKCSPASSPPLFVGQDGEVEIHFHSETSFIFARFDKKSDTYRSSSIGNRILSE